jgi:uncharacterized membrane protein required for colicin V production
LTVSSLDWLSIVLLVILVADFVVGFRRGFVKQLFDFAGIIIAILVAINRWQTASDLLQKWFPSLRPPGANMVGFLALLIITLLLVDLIGQALASAVSGSGISTLNSFGGAALRIVRSCLIISVVLVALVSLNMPSITRVVESSPVAMRIIKVAPSIWDGFEKFMPENLYIPGLTVASKVTVRGGSPIVGDAVTSSIEGPSSR